MVPLCVHVHIRLLWWSSFYIHRIHFVILTYSDAFCPYFVFRLKILYVFVVVTVADIYDPGDIFSEVAKAKWPPWGLLFTQVKLSLSPFRHLPNEQKLFTEMLKKECFLEGRLNSWLPVTAPNVTEAEWPFYERGIIYSVLRVLAKYSCRVMRWKCCLREGCS